MRKKYLINIVLFSFLFMVFILLGSLLWAWQWQRMAIICFVLAIPAVFGQLFTIALLSKTKYKASNTISPTATKEANHE